MVQVAIGGTVIATYAYDGQNRLIVTDVAGGLTTDRYYAGDQMLSSIDRAPGSPSNGDTYSATQYVWSPRYVDAPILRTQATFTYSSAGEGSWSSSTSTIYYLTDANNNVTAVTDGSGNVLERYSYDAYGKATIILRTCRARRRHLRSATSFIFAGMQLDPTTGLYYDNGRWYNPSTGGSITTRSGPCRTRILYRYASNDPADLTDPTGLVASGDGNLAVGRSGRHRQRRLRGRVSEICAVRTFAHLDCRRHRAKIHTRISMPIPNTSQTSKTGLRKKKGRR